MIQLNNESLELLRVCLNHHKPELLYVIDSQELINIDSGLGNELRQAVGNEFCRDGLKQDDEPNEYGLELEELIDKIGRLFI